MPFPQSLTTAPFVRSSTGWFEVSSCKPTSGDLLPSLVKHRKLSLAFVTHVRQAARPYGLHTDLCLILAGGLLVGVRPHEGEAARFVAEVQFVAVGVPFL